MCSLFLPRLLFSTRSCWKKHMPRFARVMCFTVFVYNRDLWNFLRRYRCLTEAWLPWASAMWSSNEANDVCSPFNFASASVWDKQGSKEANKIIRLACICLKGIRISLVMAGDVFPRLLMPQLILKEDQITLLDLVTPSTNSVLNSPRTWWILEAGAHQMELPSPLISWVNPFPSYK